MEVPSVAEDGKYTLSVTNEEFTEDASGEITFSFDVALLREGLRQLLDFKFRKHTRYNLPGNRLKLIESQIHARAKLLLEK